MCIRDSLILDVLLGDPPLFPRHEEVELSWQILDPIEAWWARHGRLEHYASCLLYTSTELVAPGTVNTMPEATLLAMADHGTLRGDTISGSYAAAADTLDALDAPGVSYLDVVTELEHEGVAKFEKAWVDLLADVAEGLRAG